MNNKNAAVSERVVVLFGLLLCLLPGLGYPAQTKSPREVTPEEAKQLVHTICETMGWTQIKSFSLDRFENKYSPDFYFFEATWANPVGSVHLDSLAVDRRTEAVWSAVICKEYSSKKLKKAQFDLRRKIGLTEDEFRKINRPGPMCD